jgi:hypothetical protein
MKKKKIPAGLYNLLNLVECHFGNLVLESGLDDSHEEYKAWQKLQKALEVTKPERKPSPK